MKGIQKATLMVLICGAPWKPPPGPSMCPEIFLPQEKYKKHLRLMFQVHPHYSQNGKILGMSFVLRWSLTTLFPHDCHHVIGFFYLSVYFWNECKTGTLGLILPWFCLGGGWGSAQGPLQGFPQKLKEGGYTDHTELQAPPSAGGLGTSPRKIWLFKPEKCVFRASGRRNLHLKTTHDYLMNFTDTLINEKTCYIHNCLSIHTILLFERQAGLPLS